MGRDVKIWRGLFFGWLIVGGAYVQDYFLGGILLEELLLRIYGISISASKNPLAQHPATNECCMGPTVLVFLFPNNVQTQLNCQSITCTYLNNHSASSFLCAVEIED